MKPNWAAIGAFSGAFSVICGAFGAHALRDRITAGDLEAWKTGVLYQAIHALALILFGLFQRGLRRDGRAAGSGTGWMFLLGTLFFSGSLYAHALGAPGAVVHAAPVGGLLLIVGWVAFGVAALGAGKDPEGTKTG